MGLVQETSTQALPGLTMANMQSVTLEPTSGRATWYGITSIQLQVSASEHITLPLFLNCKKSLMLTGIHHMQFQLNLWRKVNFIQADE